MSDELTGLLIAAAHGLVIGLVTIRFLPRAQRRFNEFALRLDWRFHAAGFAMFALSSFLSFGEGKNYSGWMFTGMASLALVQAVTALRHGTLLQRSQAGSESAHSPIRNTRRELAATIAVTMFGGVALQRVADFEPEVPDLLVGKHVFVIGPGPYVVPQGVDFVLTGPESSGPTTAAVAYVEGKPLVGHGSSRLSKPPESQANLSGTYRVKSGSTLELRPPTWTGNSVEPPLTDDALRAWGYLESTDV